MSKVKEVRLRGTVPSRSDAAGLLAAPGDAVLVHRDVDRLLLLQCPSGCGTTIVLNLDRRAGKAWSMRRSAAGPTLYPSVWLPTGCESHFIVVGGRVLWCDDDDSWFNYDRTISEELLGRIRAALRPDFRSFIELAAQLDADPWETLMVCRRLVKGKEAVEGIGEARGSFAARS